MKGFTFKISLESVHINDFFPRELCYEFIIKIAKF